MRVFSFSLLPAASICAAAALCVGPAFADASTTVDLNPFANALTGAIVEIVTVGLGLIGVWLAVLLKNKWGIDVQAQVASLEANYRDTLHSAVETWTNAARAKFGPNLSIDVGSPAAKYILDGVSKSATDAVNKLGPTEAWILAKAAGVLGVTPVIVPAAP